jgi:hypothetical protein
VKVEGREVEVGGYGASLSIPGPTVPFHYREAMGDLPRAMGNKLNTGDIRSCME